MLDIKALNGRMDKNKAESEKENVINSDQIQVLRRKKVKPYTWTRLSADNEELSFIPQEFL